MRTIAALAGTALACGCLAGVAQARPLGQATVTETNNDVRYQAAKSAERPAKPKDIVRGADMLRTGQKSQAEIEFVENLGACVGTHAGPGSVGFFWFQDD